MLAELCGEGTHRDVLPYYRGHNNRADTKAVDIFPTELTLVRLEEGDLRVQKGVEVDSEIVETMLMLSFSRQSFLSLL